MGRRVSTGVSPGGIGDLSVSQQTISSVLTNSDVIIAPDGTGIVQLQKATTITAGDLTINAQGDLRLADADSSNYVALQSAATVSANYTITLPSAVSTRNGFVAYTDTSGNLTWGAADPFRGAYSTQNSSFAAVAFNCYFVNTSSTAVTATLPASPTLGDTIRFMDVAKTFDSNTFTVSRNGNLIQGDAADMTVTSESAAFDLIWSGATYGWRIFSI